MKALFEKVDHLALDFFGPIRPPKTHKIDEVSVKMITNFLSIELWHFYIIIWHFLAVVWW